MKTLNQDERVAVARLRALLELLPTALDRYLASSGLSAFEFTLLEAIHESEAGRLRLTALAARTNATLPRLSRVVTGLERKGLVRRVACEEDARATNAVLTEDGRRAFEHSLPQYEHALRSTVLDGFDREDVRRLAELSYSILCRLDPDHRLDVTAPVCDADPVAPDLNTCPADPAA